MIRTFALALGTLGTILAVWLDSAVLGFAVYTLAVFMAGWTISWPFAQAAMIGEMVYEEYELVFEPEDDDEDEQ